MTLDRVSDYWTDGAYAYCFVWIRLNGSDTVRLVRLRLDDYSQDRPAVALNGAWIPVDRHA